MSTVYTPLVMTINPMTLQMRLWKPPVQMLQSTLMVQMLLFHLRQWPPQILETVERREPELFLSL